MLFVNIKFFVICFFLLHVFTWYRAQVLVHILSMTCLCTVGYHYFQTVSTSLHFFRQILMNVPFCLMPAKEAWSASTTLADTFAFLRMHRFLLVKEMNPVCLLSQTPPVSPTPRLIPRLTAESRQAEQCAATLASPWMSRTSAEVRIVSTSLMAVLTEIVSVDNC